MSISVQLCHFTDFVLKKNKNFTNFPKIIKPTKSHARVSTLMGGIKRMEKSSPTIHKHLENHCGAYKSMLNHYLDNLLHLKRSRFFVNTEQLLIVFDFGWENPRGDPQQM